MLKQLYIKNFTLIEELDIQFRNGFSVITGETGAGKSIILGAIGLLLGQRADSKTIKSGCDKCTIEAHFDLSGYGMDSFFSENDIDYDATDCIIRRELAASGKSRAFINDIPVQLMQMRELGEQLMDIHSQHQNLLLNKEDFQLNVVDTIAENTELLAAYAKSYQNYRQTKRELEALRESIRQANENEDFLRFQFKELDDAHLEAGEQETLEQHLTTVSHTEEIKGALFEADNLLSNEDGGIVTQLRSVAHALHSIENVYPEAAELSSRIETCHIELKDISQDISSQVDNIDFDPAELDSINQRLDKIYTLENKFHATSINELLSVHKELQNQLEHIDNSEEELHELEMQLEALTSETKKKAGELTESRKKAAQTIEKKMIEYLVPLGLPHVRFQIQIQDKPLSADGQDKISFLFSANTNTPLSPVSQIASGGEIARVMLSLKAMISGTIKLPTIIFDEIDTGVSGKIAEKMALMMKEMGENNRQVISITHLPQIAALGNTHYKVSKEETENGTATRMVLLSNEERVTEIAQMLSGSDVTEAAINNAKELLKS